MPFDFKRPAAYEQLVNIAQRNNVDAFTDKQPTPERAIKSLKDLIERETYDAVIIDTAGRTEIDPEVMQELKFTTLQLEPKETLLVMDSTIGQNSLSVAEGFANYVKLTGGIFTKYDSSAKGGSILSFKYVTGASVKFVGIGEKIQDIEPFDPSRIISRILGRGDIQTLVEKASTAISAKESEEMMKKVESGKFDFADFKKELEGIVKMGGLSQVIGMLPQTQVLKLPANFSDESQIKRMFAIIDSMTEEERHNPDIINGSRKQRIAKGAGVEKFEINQLIKNFSNFRNLSKNLKAIDRIMKLR